MPITTEFDQAFRRLLSAWVSHHDLTMSNAPIPELYESRQSLEDARHDARTARKSLG